MAAEVNTSEDCQHTSQHSDHDSGNLYKILSMHVVYRMCTSYYYLIKSSSWTVALYSSSCLWCGGDLGNIHLWNKTTTQRVACTGCRYAKIMLKPRGLQREKSRTLSPEINGNQLKSLEINREINRNPSRNHKNSTEIRSIL